QLATATPQEPLILLGFMFAQVLASICAPRQMPRSGFCSLSATPIQWGFPADELIRVVGAHGAAKNDGTAVVCKRRGERAVAGLAHIECVSVAAKPVADVARLGPLLVKPDMGVTAQLST